MCSFFDKLTTIDETKLTCREKMIVEYIRSNINNIVTTDMKIERLAQEIGIGYSAIYGLLKKLNFNGYRELWLSLWNDVNYNSIQENDTQKNYIRNSYLSVIKKNYQMIDQKQISEILKLINKSSRIFLVYDNSQLLTVVKELENNLLSLGNEIMILNNQNDNLDQIIFQANEFDLFIFYTINRYSSKLFEDINQIKLHQSKVVLVSGKFLSKVDLSLIDSTITLALDLSEENQTPCLSKMLGFIYFNDLLNYYLVNLKQQ